jgi:hypothetical protein
MKDTYINLFTDFGFKKLFGEENSKEHLIAFLNTLLPAKHQYISSSLKISTTKYFTINVPLST